ncbi:MAG: hypothetical protein LUE10_06695 [Alistipes sp.]|nr:hypothetical protein [Alistipes sp.]
MRNRLTIFIVALAVTVCNFSPPTHAQDSRKDFTGMYGESGVGLIIAPDSVFAIAAMSTLEIGSWDVYKNYLILQPAGNLFRDRFYLTASYNQQRDDVEITFHDFEDLNGHYSFDNDELTNEMKPGYSAFSYYMITENFPRGSHSSLQVSEKPFWNDEQVCEALTYSFTLPDEYNEFQVYAMAYSPDITYPFLLTIEEDALRIEGQEISKLSRYDELEEKEILLMERVSGYLRESAHSDYFSLNYPGTGAVITYDWKEERTVKF